MRNRGTKEPRESGLFSIIMLYVFHVVLSLLFALVCIAILKYQCLETGEGHAPPHYLAAAFLTFFLAVLSLNFIRRRLGTRHAWWPYAASLILFLSSGSIFIDDYPDDFQFLGPSIEKPGHMPSGPPSSWGHVKLSINEDCRRATAVGKSRIMQRRVKVPSGGVLSFGIGVLYGHEPSRGAEVSVLVSTRLHPAEEADRWTLPLNRNAWFDKTVDLSSYAGQEVKITIRDHTPRPMGGAPYLFITPPGVVSRESRGPNIILVVVDSLRYDAVTHRPGQGHTPRLHQRMNSKGAVFFKRNYAQSSWTSPSVASLLTSLMPAQNGVVARSGLHLSHENLTIMEQVQEAGYLTAGFSTNSLVSGPLNFGQGMDFIKVVGRDTKDWWKSAKRLNRSAMKWIEKNRDLPFVLYMHYMDPHYPYLPPPRHFVEVIEEKGLIKGAKALYLPFKIYDRDIYMRHAGIYKSLYQAEVSYWDEAFDRFMDRLEALDSERPCIVIVVSDHGEEFLDHGNRGHGTSLYEELVHVPLVIFMPGNEEPVKVGEITQNMDIGPTILDLLGIKAAEKFMGRSLLPLMGQDKKDPSRVAYSEMPPRRSKRFSSGVMGVYMRACISRDSKVIEKIPARGSPEIEHYRLDRDPREANPLKFDGHARAGKMTKMLQEFFNTLPGKVPEDDMHRPPLPDPIAKKRLRDLGYIND